MRYQSESRRDIHALSSEAQLRSVLLIDDDSDMAEMLAEYLRPEGLPSVWR